jgi:hypothetical protein
LSQSSNKESVVSQEYSRSQVLDIIEAEALKRHIPKDDFLRFADIETGGKFNPNAHSDRSSASGLFQFTNATAAAYGLTGHQTDPVANTAAAAQLYLDNRDSLIRNHNATGHPYLSGKPAPDGLDMYLAHQQGAAGYRSVQDAIATGKFDKDSTRSNILNNVGDDFKTLTGHPRSELSGMSDRDMAKAFVGYWNAKFEHVQIPEKGIGAAHTQAPTAPHAAPHVTPPTVAPAHPAPSAQTPAPTGGPNDITIGQAYALTEKYQNVTHYGLGAKNPDKGSVDCSGWVVKMQNATMEEINEKAGRDVFSEKEMFSKGNDAAATIVEKSAQRSGQLLEGKQITAGVLKEGMIIGEDNGPQSFDKGRYKGIDHITMVVRDPKTNELMISQSSSHKGVHLQPVADYLAYKQSHGVQLYATDPLAKARGLMHDSHPTVAPASTHPTRAAHAGHASAPHAEHGVLKEGHKSDDVLKLQEQLKQLGIKDAQGHPLTPDREFGPRTTEAVKAFQAAHHLEQDGQVGPQTMKQLQEALKHAPAEQAQAAKAASPAEGMIDRMMSAMKNGDHQSVLHAAGDAARTAVAQDFRGNVTAQVNAQEHHSASQQQQQNNQPQQDHHASHGGQRLGGH